MKKKTDMIGPTSKFLEVECRKCGKKSVIFNKSATLTKCDCGEELSEPTGGYARIKGKVLKELE